MECRRTKARRRTPLVAEFVAALRQLGALVETGVFGADMHVALVNDGTVTVVLEL